MTSWQNCGRMLYIDSDGNNRATAGPAADECRPPLPNETAMSIILSAVLLISYAGLLAIALILAARVDNDDQE